MTWPQIVILLGMILNLILAIWSHARNPKMSSGLAAATIVVSMIFLAIYAEVLHCGGFW